MKLRSYFRQPVTQTATLKLPDGAEIPCKIINFCRAGLCLKMSEADAIMCASGVDPKTEATVNTASGTGKVFRLNGRLSHVTPNGSGFVFSSPPPFAALLELQQSASTNPLAEGRACAQHIAIHQECLRRLELALKPLTRELPDQIRCALQEQSATGKDGAAADFPSKAVQDFARRLDSMVARFVDHAMEQARLFVVPDLAMHPEAGVIYGHSSTQRLVFEDWMNLIDKVIRLESKYEDLLSIVATRFGSMVQKRLDHHENPFGPSVLFHSFHYSIGSEQLDNYQRNLIYEVFGRLLDRQMAELYVDLRTLTDPLDDRETSAGPNDISSSGLTLVKSTGATLQLEEIPSSEDDDEATVPFPFHVPELENRPVPSPREDPFAPTYRTAMEMPMQMADLAGTDQPKPEIRDNPAPTAEKVLSRPVVAPRVPDAFSAFVFLSRYAEYQAHKPANNAMAGFDSAAMIDALHQLLNTAKEQQIDYFHAPRLHSSLAQMLAQNGHQGLLSNIEIRETLQILGLLLDAILADAAIPAGVMPYFRKLQIPLLITAFADPSLLHGDSHAAREVLNQMDYLAQATNAQGEIDNPKLLQSLNKIVERIAAGVIFNPSGTFADALESMKKLTSPLTRAYTTRLERVVETCEGGHRLEQSRRLIEREIEARIGGKTIPSIIPALLEAGWRQLMVLTNLRQGNDNDEYRRQLSLIDLLLSRLDKDSPSSLPSQFNVDGLKEFILTELSSIGVETPAISQMSNDIGELLVTGCEGPGAISYVAIPPVDNAREIKESILLDRLQGFRVGDWLKFTASRTTWVPMRLTWIGKNPPRYVFVNRRGVKTLDLDASRFTQLLDDKRASRIESLEEFSLIERTAKTLLHTLRDRLR